MAPARVPLAWLNLAHHQRRFLVALAGVAFAVLLMFVELGFWNALLDSMVALIDCLDADLVIVSKAKYSLTVREPFTRRRLQQARTALGVETVTPLYLRMSLWRNPDNPDPDHPSVRPIRVLAFDPASPALRLPEVRRHAEDLKLPDTVLMDTRARWFYGRRDPDITRELGRRSIRVVGNFTLGTDFVTDGNLVMSDTTFAKHFPSRDPARSALAQVEIGLVRAAPDADLDRVKAGLADVLPDDVAVLTRDELARQEKEFWQTSTPVGFVFGLGLAMGFVVGVIICYQILAADVADHQAEYATLKAIGYPDGYLTKVVLQEALLLSLFGFVPGVLLSRLVYELLAGVTGLPLVLTAARAAGILVLTVAMCLLSGMLVIRKVQAADPAEVF